MDDAFGGMVSSLFEEFEKDRESTGTFITYDKTEEGNEDKSKIVFRIGDSESESSSSSDSEDENESRDESKVETKNDSEKYAEEEEEPRIELNGQEEPVFSNEQTNQHKLLHEKNTYQRFARLVDSTRHVPDESSPACQVFYHNNSFSRRYRPMIENFINSLFYRHMMEGNQQLPELPLKSSTLTCVDINKSLPVTLRNNIMWKSHAIIGCGQYHQYFIVDTVGWTLVDYNPALTDGWERPNYEQIFEDAIPVDEEDESAGPKGPERLKSSCFNCGGEHMITDCKEEKDFQRIRQNRNAFLQQQQHSKVQRSSSVRYHKDSDVDSKFCKFRPGHISHDLRKALGLHSDQLPLYIYKMRVMGYPPGWLEDAKVQTSGLAMFDKDGKEVVSNEEVLEDGEVKEKKPPEATTDFDVNKVIEYPGFTVPVPEDMIDESQDFGYPPLQEHQLKSTLQAQNDQRETIKKRKAEYEEEMAKKRFKETAPQEEEMDLDDESNTSISNGHSDPPLPIDTPPGKPPLPKETPPPTPENAHLGSRGPFLPPLPVDTPPGKPPIPDGTPPPTPEGFRPKMKLPLPKNPSFVEDTPPDTPDSDVVSNPIQGKSVSRQNSGLSSKQTSISSVSSSLGRSDSPSLEDLEKQYQLLQQKLEEGEDTGDVELQVLDSVDDEDDEIIQSEFPQLQKKMTREGSSTSINTFGELGSGSPQHSLPGTPIIITPSSSFTNLNSLQRGGSTSISKDFGTPILSSKPGKVESLPDAVKFGDGIEDHIPFENLPDSTGTFEKMRGLISKIRDKISFRKKKS